MLRSLASLMGRPPAAARTADAHLGFMPRYLVIVLGLLAMLGLLLIAGLGAAGSWRGAWRYVSMWFKHIGAMVLLAVLLGLILGGMS